VVNNTFVHLTDATYGTPNGLCVSTTNGQATAVRRVPTSAEIAKFAADGNTNLTSLAGFDYALAMTCAGGISHQFDATPSPELTTVTATPVNDGFFSPVAYRGAFGGSDKNWLSGWTMAASMAATSGVAACPTDVNADGTTNGSDYLLLLGNIFTTCQ
jgi:hypothetical protein